MAIVRTEQTYIVPLWRRFQGAETTPRCLSGRLVYGAWYFMVMVASATYTANLAAFLTVQRLDSGQCSSVCNESLSLLSIACFAFSTDNPPSILAFLFIY